MHSFDRDFVSLLDSWNSDDIAADDRYDFLAGQAEGVAGGGGMEEAEAEGLTGMAGDRNPCGKTILPGDVHSKVALGLEPSDTT